jgi:hypothetical protein
VRDVRAAGATDRLRTFHLIGAALSEFFDLDRGLLRTLGDLLVDPGRPVRGYWAGHTRPWVDSAKFFLVAFAVAQFVAWRTGALLDFSEGFTEAGARETFDSASSMAEFLAEYLVLFIGGSLVVPVVVGSLVSRRTVAEMAVFAFYTFGALSLLGGLCLLADAAVPVVPGAEIVAFGSPFYLAWSIRRSFEVGWIRTIVSTVAFLAGVLFGLTFLVGFLYGVTGGFGPQGTM